MDTREESGTFDLFVWEISQQPLPESLLEDPSDMPTHIHI